MSKLTITVEKNGYSGYSIITANMEGSEHRDGEYNAIFHPTEGCILKGPNALHVHSQANDTPDAIAMIVDYFDRHGAL